MLLLTDSEEAEFRPLLEQKWVNGRPFRYSMMALVEQWDDVVKDVETGYSDCIYEYWNDLRVVSRQVV